MVSRGEIWRVQLDDDLSATPQHTRLCVVVSPNEMHQHLQTVMVAPMTTRTQVAPFRVAVTFEGKTGLILLDQIRTLDKARLLVKQGDLEPAVLAQTLNVLHEIFAI
ncbi:MAG: type II toxin-antitoxin system PemK/MazF family toxin [Formosimonas sp.]